MGKYSLTPQSAVSAQPSFLIGTYKDNGEPNFALVTWATFCSSDPLMFLFTSLIEKMTRDLIEKNKVFSVNLVTKDMMYMADYFGTNSGYSIDKAAQIGVESTKGEVLPVPVLSASPFVYECEFKEVEYHGNGAIYIGEVKNVLVDEKIKDTSYGKLDMAEIEPLICSMGYYYKTSDSIGQVGLSEQK